MMGATPRDVVVVGGGQAGLALGYYLGREGMDFTILEAAAEPAASWRARWESLRLFTPARYSALPGLRFAGDPRRYPTRDEVVTYLTDYARHFNLPVELNSKVRSVRREDDGYLVALDDRTYRAAQVVIATGPFQAAFVPAMAGEVGEDVVQVHRSAYRSPESLPSGRVLLVGGGNSGYQIAQELSEWREVHVSVGSRQTPLPQRILGRDLFWYLEGTGLMRKTVDSRIGSRMSSRDTLVGSTSRRLRRTYGVVFHERAVGAAGSMVRFEDGDELEVTGIVWATGFRTDHSWIDAPIFDTGGRAVHRRGVTDAAGLYFIGLSWQHTRDSALLGWVKDDAEFIAAQIASYRSRRSRHGRQLIPQEEL